MKPIYESIIPYSNISFKVESYNAESCCMSAGWHIHPEYEIVYVKNGSGILRIGDKTHYYKNGVLVFLAGNIPHSDFGNKQYENSQEVVIQFSKEFVDEKLNLFPELGCIKKLIQTSKHVLIFHDSVKSYLSNSFEHFSDLSNQGKLINLLSILNYLSTTNDFHKLIHFGLPKEFREKETFRLKNIFEYINNNYNHKIEIKDIAIKVGLTPNSFSRFFKKMTNRTFIDFLNEFRIRKAVDSLNERDMTISEVMFLSGFSSPSYFSKQFIKYQGTTPSNYVKKAKLL
ncbi:AraC family transcriptional regulator [Croceitalea rosinachiae]|uniref:AraC family transcriptional regulator n=1 Tax=Croceitalea rosinachiae TaxID=3075596 RepID=A0ABU3AEJ6_9FLAO|nr:AraC family transcriptional regulator [Croceitalea sp. F388]MDT0608603.1 AraC family transcriptional regulator [Croceitalea sp. F388]